MIKVAYWHCEECAAEKLFAAYETPVDEHMAQCVTCGFRFGYMEHHETVVDESGRAQLRSVVKPVLSEKTLKEGIKRVRDLERERLRTRRELSDPRTRQRLEQGLASDDPRERLRLLNSNSPSLRALARRRE